MTDTEAVPETPLREQIAREIRTLLAWHNISAAELARRTGMKQPYVSRRMQGEVAFDVDDLEVIAGVLEVDVLDLFPGGPAEPVATAAAAEPHTVARPVRRRGRRLTGSYPARTGSASPVRPTGHLVRVTPGRHSPDRPPNRREPADPDRPVRLRRPGQPRSSAQRGGKDEAL